MPCKRSHSISRLSVRGYLRNGGKVYVERDAQFLCQCVVRLKRISTKNYILEVYYRSYNKRMVNCCICWKEHCPSLPRQFHSFPKNAERREKWFHSIGYTIHGYKHARICSDHFTKNDYYDCDMLFQTRRLKQTAIPSVFTQKSCKGMEKDSIIQHDDQDASRSIQHEDQKELTTKVQCEPTLVVKNSINPKKKQSNINKIKKVFLKTGKYNIECMKKTEFVTTQSWIKFVKFLNYNRYLNKLSLAQNTRLQRNIITMNSVMQTLRDRNLVTRNCGLAEEERGIEMLDKECVNMLKNRLSQAANVSN